VASGLLRASPIIIICRFPIPRGGWRCIYQGVCRILIEMADAFVSSSWRILKLHSCSGISLATTTAIPEGAGPLRP
jgi:hypothetical protein